VYDFMHAVVRMHWPLRLDRHRPGLQSLAHGSLPFVIQRVLWAWLGALIVLLDGELPRTPRRGDQSTIGG
jgi:hypothetical protein